MVKNVETSNEKMSPREQLDNQARKELFAAQKYKNIRYLDSKRDYVWLGAKTNWKTMEMTINKIAMGSELRRGVSMFDILKAKKPTQYTLRFGPKGYELITKDAKWEKVRKLEKEADIKVALDNFDRRLREVSRVKQERDRKAKREANQLADAETQNERDEADQNLAASLEDMA